MNIRIREARPEDLEIVTRFNQYMALETARRRLDDDVIRAGVQRVLQGSNKGRYFIAECND